MKATDKKGQGLSLNFIIIAALGLIVLVIAVMIFMRESGETSDTLGNCFTQGGQCYEGDSPTVCQTNNAQFLYGATCPDKGEGENKKKQVCCVKLKETT